ncbi:MAG: NAD(P)-dependent alcohol dehydrogenase [Pseudomonadota bacterium]
MKAMRIEAWGVENIRPIELPDPRPGPGEALLRMRAVSINPRDLIMAQGGYGRMAAQPPLIPLCDGAGEVIALGEGAVGVAVGDLVCPNYSRTWLQGLAHPTAHLGAHGGMIDGTACELMSIPAEALVKAPRHLSAREAATLPCAAVTAWNAIVEQGDVGEGDRVLIQGTGGVALFALQFAKLRGAEVILISSSAAKLETAGALGADHLINYRETERWDKAALEITGGVGVDHVVEVGGAGTLDKAINAVRPSGAISLIGVLGGGEAAVSLGKIVTRNIRLQGVTLGGRDMFERMAAAMAEHQIRPVIDEQDFELQELGQALANLSKGGHVGKVVCEL